MTAAFIAPPRDVIEAADKVGAWFAQHNITGWQLGPCADRFTPTSSQVHPDMALPSAPAPQAESCSLRLCARADHHAPGCTTYDPARKGQGAAAPELPDLDRLEALARAATPGEWTARPHGRVVGGPIRHYVNGSTQAQIAAFSVTFHEQAPDDEPERQQANTEFCAAANPAAVLELIALARRDRPEGEAPQAELHVEARECSSCGHIGINDSSDTLAACHNCDWSGPSPADDHCHGCAQSNCMGAACPRCGAIYKLLVEADITAPAAQHAENGAQVASAQEQFDQWQHARLFANPPQSVTPYDAYIAGLAAQSQGAQATLVQAVFGLDKAIHQVLIAGGDYGDELSDHGLRDALKRAQLAAYPALMAAGVEKTDYNVNPLSVLVDRAALAAKAEAPAPSKPTDISIRLREYAANPGYSHNDYADTMRQAAEEIERYYGGMMAWKQTAEKKDRDWQAERMGRVDDRCAARAQQAAAPGALDAYEMTRLRRLMKALGQEDAFERDDEHVRGSLCTVLGIAAGRIERAPGTPEAPAEFMPFGRFHSRNHADGSVTTFHTRDDDPDSFVLYQRAAQLDGGQGGDSPHA